MFDDILMNCSECKKLEEFLEKEYGGIYKKYGNTNVESIIGLLLKLSKDYVDILNDNTNLRIDVKDLLEENSEMNQEIIYLRDKLHTFQQNQGGLSLGQKPNPIHVPRPTPGAQNP